MVEKIRNISNKKFILFSILSCLLILTIGTTYAFFTTNILGNSDAKSTQVYAGIMSLKLDGTTITSADGMYPGASHTIEFSVENTGTLTTTYELDMKEVYNDLNNSYMVYTITKNDELVKEETVVPQIDDILLPAVVIAPQEIDNYKLTITYKNSDSLQNSDEGKSFSGRVQISGIDSSNYLQAKVLARSINANEPDYESPDPVAISNEEVLKDQEVSVNSLVNGNMSIGDGYKYNKSSGLYTLTNLQTNQTFNKSTIGKYACANNNGVCQAVYKIKEVEESEAKENYSQTITENFTVSYTSSSNKIVAESFHFDQDTGYFILENLSELKSYDSSDVGKYTCNSNSTSGQCTIMYKINSVTDTTLDNVDRYSRSANYNTITKADKYNSTSTSVLTSESGVYKTEDDDGESYYFRGKIDNNYVSFANNIWRIVRINGDGSIRLIHASDIGTSKFNLARKVGYTYDNESECTKESPCISDYNKETSAFANNKTATDSIVKTYLEDWYINNLKDYDDKINLSNFCNDTTITSTNAIENATYYGGHNRILKLKQPSLKCPNPSTTDGGNYKLKIGLLTADEINYAGLSYRQITTTSSNTSKIADKTNYLYYSRTWYSMTPHRSNSTSSYMLYVSSGRMSNNDVTGSQYIRPVINLKSDIQITGGDGTETNPYVVE
ncbi:MAG TPA: CalY family protein [Bacilli bacterium]|nr:CalY family protein [Bacilli bacterium]